MDSSDSVFAAEPYGPVIQRIDLGGAVSIFAGMQEAGSVADGGFATEAQLDSSSSLALDTAGNQYHADNWNAVRWVDTGGLIMTFYSISSNVPRRVRGLAADGSGSVYIGNGRMIRRIDSDGTVSIVAGLEENGYGGDGGPGRTAKLSVSSLAVSRSGASWLADIYGWRNRTVRRQVLYYSLGSCSADQVWARPAAAW